MIIRMTVHDNDFTGIIESFSRNLANKIMFARDMDPDENPNDWYEKEFLPKKTIRDIIMNHEELTDEDKALMKAAVIIEWANYVPHAFHDDKEDSEDYLKRNFEVTISDTYVDKWENDEVVYYFTNPNLYISQ